MGSGEAGEPGEARRTVLRVEGGSEAWMAPGGQEVLGEEMGQGEGGVVCE